MKIVILLNFYKVSIFLIINASLCNSFITKTGNNMSWELKLTWKYGKY